MAEQINSVRRVNKSKRAGVVAGFAFAGALMGGVIAVGTEAMPGPKPISLADARQSLTDSKVALTEAGARVEATKRSLPEGCSQFVLRYADFPPAYGGDQSPIIVAALEAPKQPCGGDVADVKTAVARVLEADQHYRAAEADRTLSADRLAAARRQPEIIDDFERRQAIMRGLIVLTTMAGGVALGMLSIGGTEQAGVPPTLEPTPEA